MLAGRLFRASRTRGAVPDSGGPAPGKLSPRAKTYLAATAVVFIVLVALLVYGLGTFGSPSTTTPTQTTTSYDVLASSVVSSAASNIPSGYLQGSSKELDANESGLVSGGYALYSNQGGALVNMTILVFGSPSTAQRYIDSVISNAAASGFTNATSTLTGYEHYGTCYGYAQADPAGGEYVANGVCTKGNVYIQVHVASTSSLPSAEGDMAGFVGAAYEGLG
jgi:hypothetical protein